jgi:hypothetical protein
MVADAIEGFETEVERLENDIGTPNGMVIATGDEGIEGVFACMAPWAVPAVVSEGYGLGEGDIEPQRPRDGCGHLCDLEGVCKASALVIVGEDKDLGLSGKATKCR